MNSNKWMRKWINKKCCSRSCRRLVPDARRRTRQNWTASRTVLLTSRCYGSRPHDKWHSLRQLLGKTAHRTHEFKGDAWSFRALQARPRAYSAPGGRSLFSLLIVRLAVCFPRRRQHLRDFFFFFFSSSLSLALFSYLGIPNNFRAHAGMQTK